MRTIVDAPGVLYLGKQGEHLARELAFREPAAWEAEFGAGTAQLLASPPGGRAYPVVLSQEDGLAVWRVTAPDTARAGYGRCELRWEIDGMVVKSKTYVTFVSEGLSGGCGCGGDNWGAYLEQVVQAGAQALAAARRAEAAADRVEVSGGGSVDIATDEEVKEMLEEVFGTGETPPEDVASDAEISEMLDEIFGSCQ